MPSTCPKADEQLLVRRACLARRPLHPPGIAAHAWLARCRVKRRCCVMRMPVHWLNTHLCRCLFAGAGGAGRCRAARAVRNAGGGAARGGGPRRLLRYGAAMYWARIGPACHLHLLRCSAVLLGACRSGVCGAATGSGECRLGVLGRAKRVGPHHCLVLSRVRVGRPPRCRHGGGKGGGTEAQGSGEGGRQGQEVQVLSRYSRQQPSQGVASAGQPAVSVPCVYAAPCYANCGSRKTSRSWWQGSKDCTNRQAWDDVGRNGRRLERRQAQQVEADASLVSQEHSLRPQSAPEARQWSRACEFGGPGLSRPRRWAPVLGASSCCRRRCQGTIVAGCEQSGLRGAPPPPPPPPDRTPAACPCPSRPKFGFHSPCSSRAV